MFTRILFPTDFSNHTRRAMDCIGGFPAIKEIILLHVLDLTKISSPTVIGSQEENAKKHLKAGEETLGRLGARVFSCIEYLSSGTVSECICATAQRENVTLIVMNAGGGGFGRGVHLGSIPFGVIHHCPVNQLILHHRMIEGLVDERYELYCPMLLSKVLFPVDFSSLSEKALNKVTSIPGIGEIILVHVMAQHRFSHQNEGKMASLQQKIDALCTRVLKRGITARGIVVSGDPVSALLQYAESEDVSLVCAIPSGKNRITELLTGCVTCSLAEQTNRPVLFLKDIS